MNDSSIPYLAEERERPDDSRRRRDYQRILEATVEAEKAHATRKLPLNVARKPGRGTVALNRPVKGILPLAPAEPSTEEAGAATGDETDTETGSEGGSGTGNETGARVHKVEVTPGDASKPARGHRPNPPETGGEPGPGA